MTGPQTPPGAGGQNGWPTGGQSGWAPPPGGGTPPPGYGQPPYGQAPYGQTPYGQPPVYAAPPAYGPAQGYPGQPGSGSVLPPPQRMSRNKLTALILMPVVFLALVAGVIGTVAYRSEKSISDAQRETVSAPEAAGGLAKVHNSSVDAELARLRSSISGGSLSNAVAAAYGDTAASSPQIIVWGGRARTSSPSATAENFFAAANRSISLIGTVSKGDPGRFGGVLQCQSVLSVSAMGETICVAVDLGVRLAGRVTREATQDPQALLRSVREDMEHT